jgi:hypothetical protein
VDEHHFDADPNFHFNVDEDPTPSFTPNAKWGKNYFYSQLRQFTTLFFSHQRQLCSDFEYF